MKKTEKQSASVHCRWMIRRDMPEVLDIESNNDFAWDEEVFLHNLRQRNVIGFIAEHGEKVVAFMVYALEKSSRITILNFAVHPQWRRLGIGRQMMEKLVSKLSSHRRTRIALNAHENNLGLHLFLRAMGFRSEGIDGEFYLFARRLANDEPADVRRRENDVRRGGGCG